jgi:hypothetical protein
MWITFQPLQDRSGILARKIRKGSGGAFTDSRASVHGCDGKGFRSCRISDRSKRFRGHFPLSRLGVI